MLDFAGDEPPPSIAGRYEVAGLIGSGATARVYQAFDHRLRRDVAIKVYERGAMPVEQLRRVREKTIQASIDHPGVVALFDNGTDGGRPYLVMQLVDGENLAQRLLAGPLPGEQVHELAVQLAEALAHVHARRVVHRDLKPANVLLGAGGPLITDFGIAHELDATHVTGTGLVTGTAAYLAPEQVVGDHAGPAADVYALGLILLECLTGEREYPGTLAESAVARLSRSPRVPDGLPASLAHALERMTAREPGQRPTAEEVRQLLQQATAVPVVDAGPRRRRPKPAVVGGCAIAATFALAVLLTRPDAAVPESGRLPDAGSALSTSPTPPTSLPARAPASTVMAGAPHSTARDAPHLAAAPRPAAGPGTGHPADGPGGPVKGKDKGPDKGKEHSKP
ncbi:MULTISPECIES: serine/threonine-protein kinase [Amycolatopsis]|uniref:Serine/threonine protein kinase n=1 Tax=Amycolatopsis bullii TaxID=941987 RepID=A0ABQ3KRX5_9PSEU|nr:serine/threonine-protein kinase [Amycolatopsis bullii]GHG47878.1 serine/threonine protein kinase [Amycolatopsis bullii]